MAEKRLTKEIAEQFLRMTSPWTRIRHKEVCDGSRIPPVRSLSGIVL